MTLSVGIVGYGVVGKRRRVNIDQHPDLEVVALCDKDFNKADILANDVAIFNNYRDLLKQPLDIVFVALSNDVAPEVTMAALNKKIHVFCEKPPGRNIRDIENVRAIERSNPGIKLKYGFNHRYHDSVREALTIIKSGEIGKIINVRGIYGRSKFISFGAKSDWRIDREIAGGGILLDQGIHMLDLMRLFINEEFSEIHSFISNDYWGYSVEDNAYALMKSGSGVVAMLHSTATQWCHQFNMDIACEKGGLIISGILSSSKSYGKETLTAIFPSKNDGGRPDERKKYYENDNSWRDEITEFADAVIRDKIIEYGSSVEALATMKLVYQIYCADPVWKSKWNLENPI
jgi:predicted dehydrogenase